MSSQNSVRKVVQMRCTSDLTRAKDLFGVISSDGSIPLVLCPKKRGPLSGPFITIPTGVTAIMGSPKDMGEVLPGTRFVPQPWVRCYYMCPNQACTYNYDVVNCPTSDNVMVEVDITFVFRITEARKFCLTLGAQKFDEMLKAVCEEAIRTMVRETNHKEIYELRGSGADHLMNILNSRFQDFGILFVNATITNVVLPSDVAGALQRITALDQKMKEHVKSHEFELKKLNDTYDLKLQELRLGHERMAAELEAEKQRLRIDLEAKQAEAEKHKELAIIKADQERSVALKKVEAELHNEKIRQETAREMAVKDAEVEAHRALMEAQHWGENKTIESLARVVEAENKANILRIEAEAEKLAQESMKDARNHELKMQLQQAMMSLAHSSKMIINGKEGGRLISAITGEQTSIVPML